MLSWVSVILPLQFILANQLELNGSLSLHPKIKHMQRLILGLRWAGADLWNQIHSSWYYAFRPLQAKHSMRTNGFQARAKISYWELTSASGIHLVSHAAPSHPSGVKERIIASSRGSQRAWHYPSMLHGQWRGPSLGQMHSRQWKNWTCSINHYGDQVNHALYVGTGKLTWRNQSQIRKEIWAEALAWPCKANCEMQTI